MDRMNVEEFETSIISICSKSLAVKSTAILTFSFTWIKIRTYLRDGSFVDISYNQETGKTAYAQIRDDRRIFGADNKNGWHWHPREDPSLHVKTDKEVTFEGFMKELEADFK
ncbi:MAG: hypothetical protein Q8O48_06050 [Anaerolineales bacterium]|nr:hypothetical protein [Anaerolineales bacterium]